MFKATHFSREHFTSHLILGKCIVWKQELKALAGLKTNEQTPANLEDFYILKEFNMQAGQYISYSSQLTVQRIPNQLFS